MHAAAQIIMHQQLVTAALVLALCTGAAGCLEPRPDQPRVAQGCDGCHGDSKSLAPPPGVWLKGSLKQSTDRGVGAHREHLTTTLTAAISCQTCHLVPTAVDAPGHMDTALPAEVTLSGLAVARNTAASFNGTQCAVYCHQGKLPGGKAQRPRWTTVDGSQVGCDGCHGYPPTGAHPAANACHLCHRQVAGPNKKILKPSLHINGKVEVSASGGCSACHGSSANAAPPMDTAGNSATSARGVGAHQRHVVTSDRHTALDCAACHVKPKAVGDKGHMDSALPAELVFGALARGDLRTPKAGFKPQWDSAKLSCKSVYCHDLDGGKTPAPSWTAAGKLACDSCHGAPPAKALSGATHPKATLTTCHTCHKGVVDSAGKIIDKSKHVNGVTDFL